MSLSTTNNRNDAIGSGSLDTFPYTFRIFKEEDLKVTTSSGGVETLLVLGVDYTVTGVGEDAGGTVILTAGNLPLDDLITTRRVVELLQETDIKNQGDFFAETHEDQMDRHTMADQQQQDELDRSIKLPETVSPSIFDPTLPADIATANRAITTNAAGDGLTLSLFQTADALRIFNAQTYDALKALALAAPTQQRWGYATDIKKEVFYTADLTVGDAGWLIAA